MDSSTASIVQRQDNSFRPSRHGVALVLILLVGAALRFGALGQESLWADEFYSLATATAPDMAGLREGVRNQGAQPAYFLMLRAFTRLAGSGDFAVRLPSALFGILAIPLLYLFVRLILPGRPWLAVGAAALLAVSPMHIWYSQEARAYALQVMLEVGALCALARGLTAKRPMGWLVGAALLVIAALEVHNFTIFLWAAFGVIFVLAGRWWRIISRKQALGLTGLMLAGATHTFFAIADRLVYRPFLQECFPTSYDATLWLDVMRAQVLGPLFSPLPNTMQVIGIALGAALCLRGMWILIKHDRVGGSVVALGWTLTLVVPTAISLYKPIIYWGQRYLVLAVPFTVVLLTANLIRPSERPPRRPMVRIAALGALILVLLLQSAYLGSYYIHYQKHLWRQVGAMLDGKDGDAPVYVIPQRNAGLQARYMRTGARVNGLELDAAAVAAAVKRRPDRPAYIICYTDLRAWLSQIGVKRPVRAWLFETWRPGQNLWVHELKAE